MNIKSLLKIVIILGCVLQLMTKVDIFKFFNSRKKDLVVENVELFSSKNIPNEYDKVLVVVSSEEDLYTAKLENNLKMILNYAKSKYEIKKITEITIDDIENSTMAVLALGEYYGLRKSIFQKIIDKNSKGEFPVLILKPSFKNPFNKYAGIKNINSYTWKDAIGVIFKETIFPGYVGDMKVKDTVSHGLMDVTLNENTKVIMTTEDEKPVIWEAENGKGKIVYVNSTFLEDKLNRGVMTQLISYMSDYYLASIYNSKVMHIDDFPAPMKPGNFEAIYSEYLVDNRTFFRTTWWSDMTNLAMKYDIIYSGYLIRNYSNDVSASTFSKLTEEEEEELLFYGRKLFEIGGEVGLHSFNHYPLSDSYQNFDYEKYDYKPWASLNDMEKGLKETNEMIKNIYGGMKLYSYVPPSNILAKEGKVAIKNAIPSIKVLCGLYIGQEKGVYETEFGRDVDVPELYTYPRFSSGFFYEDMKWPILNGIATHGAFVHFFHPDDIFDPIRSKNKNWEEMLKEMQEILGDVNYNFPFLRARKQSDAFVDYVKQKDIQVFSKREDDKIYFYFKNHPKESHHYFRLKRGKIKKIKGGEYEEIQNTDNYTLYYVKFTDIEPVITIK